MIINKTRQKLAILKAKSLKAINPNYNDWRKHYYKLSSKLKTVTKCDDGFVADTLEHAENSGFEWIGWSDEVLDIRHTGWYIDDNCDRGTYRGCVFRTQGRKRKGGDSYVYMFSGFYNSESEVYFIEKTPTLSKGLKLVCDSYFEFSDSSTTRQMAIRADYLAEYESDIARDYYRKEELIQQKEEKKGEINELRKEFKSLRSEIKTNKLGENTATLFNTTLKSIQLQVHALTQEIEDINQNL